MMDKIPSYVLNDFLKFERKLYNVFGIKIGRSISVKSLLYFLAAFITLMLLPNIPLIGSIVGLLPISARVILAGGIAWLLGDVGTENRAPIRFFLSLVSYHWMKLKKESYYKGRILVHQPPISFNRLPIVKEPLPQQPPQEAPAIKFTKGAMVYDGKRSERTGTAGALSHDGKRPAAAGLHTAPIQGH